MEIEKLLQIKTDQSDKIGMILSNNIDLMYKDKACVTIDNWEKLTMEILAWHENEVKNLAIQRVVVNEAVLRYETCQRGRMTMCKCKNNQDCKEQSEVTYYCECDNQVGKKDVSGTLYCINCEWDIKQ